MIYSFIGIEFRFLRGKKKHRLSCRFKKPRAVSSLLRAPESGSTLFYF